MTPTQIAQQLAEIADHMWGDDDGEEFAKVLEAVLEDYCATKNIAPPDTF